MAKKYKIKGEKMMCAIVKQIIKNLHHIYIYIYIYIYIKKFKRRNKKQEYKNYYTALKNCYTEELYENSELCKMIGDKTKTYIEHLKHEPYIKLDTTNAFLVSAIYSFLQKFSVVTINLLDFGGACGAHYFETRRFFPNDIKFNWIVVETSEMVKSAKEHGLVNKELSFIDNLGEINTSIDFVHSSGTLQYVPDYSYFLSQLIKSDAKYMLFNRMMFNENDRDIITIQTSKLSDNGHGKLPDGYTDKIIQYPHTTISYTKFNKMFQNSYDLKWCFDEVSGSFRINDEKIIGRGLLYINRTCK